jgi:hypothetical protein
MPIGRITRLVLTPTAIVVGLAFLAYSVLRALDGFAGPPQSLTYILSPDGRLKAVTALEAGGGGIPPYCIKSISVVSAGASDQDAAQEQFLVFAGDCDSRPVVEWLSNTGLRITFSLNHRAANPNRFSLKGRDMSGMVTVAFVVTE